MSLATRCTDCGTVFRVVPDQLKVSDGWVRCGRCNAVFNAQEQLVDLDAQPSAPSNLEAPRVDDREHPDVAAEAPALDLGSPQPPAPGPVADRPPPTGGAIEVPTAPAQAAAELAPPPVADAEPDVVVSIGPPPASEPPMRVDADEVMPTPSFLRAPDRSTRRALAARRASVVVAGVLVVALTLQLALGWRNELAARAPGLRSMLIALCEPLGCTVTAPRRIEALAVEASGLARIEGAAVHRLTVALRNRAETAVLAPSIELALTDAQGALVARKVLAVADFGQTAQAVDPGAELALQALVSTGERRVAGYTVEIFYP